MNELDTNHEAQLYAIIATLREQVAELTAGAIIHAHRQCIAIEALTAIRDMAIDPTMCAVADRAIRQIEEVTP